MRLVLEVNSGPLKGKQIEANPGETVSIGRTPKATNPIADNFMSGAHFAVECGADGCRLRDLNSRNGTKLNDELVTDAALKNGDRIFAGRTDFIVRIESGSKSKSPAPLLKPGETPTGAVSRTSGRIKKSEKAKKSAPSSAGENIPTPEVKPARHQETAVDPAAKIAIPVPTPVEPTPPPPPLPPPAEVNLAASLASYEAATPEGRLFQILSNQPQNLMALVDAVHDPQILELLQTTREEYQSLYRNNQNPRIAPHLIRLPPRSPLLKQMIQKGWGHQWGVYLTCPLSLAELREYFRTSLMVAMPDGMELFSRFYDPIFFRTFLETCTAAEAEKFFGPITSYLMEDERPEILLEFRRSSKGADKKGHLLSDLA
jgi:pSer/pThr/pTyr-binding forkhead associated (FHA) protein